MNRTKWALVAMFLLGLVWPVWVLIALVAYELLVRKGKTVVAFWAEHHIGDRRRGGY